MPRWKEIENADLAEIWPLRGRNTTESFSLPDERLENVNDQSQFNRKSRDLPFYATPLSIWRPLKSLFVTFWLLVEESTTKQNGIQWIQMIQYINIWKSLFSEIVLLILGFLFNNAWCLYRWKMLHRASISNIFSILVSQVYKCICWSWRGRNLTFYL